MTVILTIFAKVGKCAESDFLHTNVIGKEMQKF